MTARTRIDAELKTRLTELRAAKEQQRSELMAELSENVDKSTKMATQKSSLQDQKTLLDDDLAEIERQLLSLGR